MWCKESDKVLKNIVLLHHMIELISCALQKPVSLYKRFLGIRFLSDKNARKDITVIIILSSGSKTNCLKNFIDDMLTNEQTLKKFLNSINHCSQWFIQQKEKWKRISIALNINSNSGLLIFRAVAEPRISTKSAKSREIHQNTRNPAKFARNLTKYMSAQYIWKLSWLLRLCTCCKRASLPWNFVTAASKQHPTTTRRS